MSMKGGAGLGSRCALRELGSWACKACPDPALPPPEHTHLTFILTPYQKWKEVPNWENNSVAYVGETESPGKV